MRLARHAHSGIGTCGLRCIRQHPAIIVYAAVAICLWACSIAQANPIPSPDRVAKTVVGTVILVGVVAGLLFVESCLTAMLLLFAGLTGLRMLGALVVINVISYVLVLLPLLHGGVWIYLAELAVVLVEAALIKLASAFEVFQADSFVRLKWRYALLVSLLGNAFSYLAGRMVLS